MFCEYLLKRKDIRVWTRAEMITENIPDITQIKEKHWKPCLPCWKNMQISVNKWKEGCLSLFLISKKLYSFTFFQYIQNKISLLSIPPILPCPPHFSSTNNTTLENAFLDKTVKEDSQSLFTPSLVILLAPTLSAKNKPSRPWEP